MAYLFYKYLINLVAIVAQNAGFLNDKLNRRNLGLREQTVPRLNGCIWVHCASLGEFEQGKVLIDSLRARYPGKKLVLTFFSASGYDKRKGYKEVDIVLYLPYDTVSGMSRLVESLHPELVLFVKYEFWFNLLDVLASKGVPFVFVSSAFRPDQYLFKPIFRSLLRRILQAGHIFVQNETSQKLLLSYDYDHVSVAGDSRIDRVIEIMNTEFSWPQLDRWRSGSLCIIAGSTWSRDVFMILECIHAQPEWKWVIAPHEITGSHMEDLRNELVGKGLFLSDLGESAELPDHINVLVINRIGLLSLIYRYGDIAYIGGGFGSGIHNTLEPAVYGLPLIFGPNYSKFQEATDFCEQGAAKVVHSSDEMLEALDYYDDQNRRNTIKALLTDYFRKNSGATTKIMLTIDSLISPG